MRSSTLARGVLDDEDVIIITHRPAEPDHVRADQTFVRSVAIRSKECMGSRRTWCGTGHAQGRVPRPVAHDQGRPLVDRHRQNRRKDGGFCTGARQRLADRLEFGQRRLPVGARQTVAGRGRRRSRLITGASTRVMPPASASIAASFGIAASARILRTIASVPAAVVLPLGLLGREPAGLAGARDGAVSGRTAAACNELGAVMAVALARAGALAPDRAVARTAPAARRIVEERHAHIAFARSRSRSRRTRRRAQPGERQLKGVMTDARRRAGAARRRRRDRRRERADVEPRRRERRQPRRTRGLGRGSAFDRQETMRQRHAGCCARPTRRNGVTRRGGTEVTVGATMASIAASTKRIRQIVTTPSTASPSDQPAGTGTPRSRAARAGEAADGRDRHWEVRNLSQRSALRRASIVDSPPESLAAGEARPTTCRRGQRIDGQRRSAR